MKPITLAAGRGSWRRWLPGRLDALTSTSTWVEESHFRTGPAGWGGAPSSTHPASSLNPSRTLTVFSEMLSKWIQKQDTGLLPLGQTNTEKLLKPGFEALSQTLKDQKKKKKTSANSILLSHVYLAPSLARLSLTPPYSFHPGRGGAWGRSGHGWLPGGCRQAASGERWVRSRGWQK